MKSPLYNEWHVFFTSVIANHTEINPKITKVYSDHWHSVESGSYHVKDKLKVNDMYSQIQS